MISAWNLLWIIPVVTIFELFAVSLLCALDDDEKIPPTESPPKPPMDEDMNRHSGLLEEE